MSWTEMPVGRIYRRYEERGRDDLPLLSVYRDHGVVPREGREDNYNKPSDDLSSYKVVRPGDLVLNKMKTWQGSLGVSSHTGIVSPAYFVGRRTLEVDDRFMHHLLRSQPLIAEYGARSKGIRPSQWDLPWEDFASIRVQLPPAETQRAIADFLDTETGRIHALITKKRRMIALLDEQRDRELDRLALPGAEPSRRSTPADAPMTGDLDDAWTAVPIGQCLERITYGFTNPMPTADDGPYLLTANDIGEGEVRFDSARRTTGDAYRTLLTEKSRPKTNDTLLTKDGTLGRVARFPGGKACVNQSVAVLRPDPTWIEPALLSELLRVPAYRDALIFNAGGTTIKHLYISRVVKQRIGLPPRHQQGDLVLALAAVHRLHDRRVAAIRRSVDLLAEHRQALITAAVTGELKVPGVAA